MTEGEFPCGRVPNTEDIDEVKFFNNGGYHGNAFNIELTTGTAGVQNLIEDKIKVTKSAFFLKNWILSLSMSP